jgi:predicted secreted protein
MIQAAGAVPAGKAVTAATKAKPCVLTVTTGAAVVGDIVVPRGTGFSAIDDRPFSVSAVATGTYTLADSDTTGETGTLLAGAKVEQPSLVELCRSTFTINNPAGATIDVTTLCDDAHKIVSGLPAIGTWQANGFYDKDDAAMWAARDYYRSGAVVVFKVQFRDNSGLTFAANVNVFDVAAGINAAVTNNMGGNVSGLVSALTGSGAGATMAADDGGEALAA